MQHTHKLDAVTPVKVDEQIGKLLESPGPQARYLEFDGVARRPGAGLCGDMAEADIDCIDEAIRKILSAFFLVVTHRRFDVPLRPFVPVQHASGHFDAALRMRLRIPSMNSSWLRSLIGDARPSITNALSAIRS